MEDLFYVVFSVPLQYLILKQQSHMSVESLPKFSITIHAIYIDMTS